MPHQWQEGNLSVSARCQHCDKNCGSVLRLQDWRCLWCRATVHASCKEAFSRRCSLGSFRLSVLPPTAVSFLDSDGMWRANGLALGVSPLLVFVNSKSGDSQGVKIMRRFKQLLNPAQVFDLMDGGPRMGLRLFQCFESFRILICGGDGSISWVLCEADKMELNKQCQVGILPLGTGNDLSRVLGWTAAFDDDTLLPLMLDRMEHAQIKMLDRWSILVRDVSMAFPGRRPHQYDPIQAYEDSVASHLAQLLQSESHSSVISSAKVLCETVKDFVARVGENVQDAEEEDVENSITHKCDVLKTKLDALLTTLNNEAGPGLKYPAVEQPAVAVAAVTAERCDQVAIIGTGTGSDNKVKARPRWRARSSARTSGKRVFRSQEQMMSRANSLKKAIRQIIEHTEKAIDEQNCFNLTSDDEGQLKRIRCSDDHDIVVVTDNDVVPYSQHTDSSDAENTLSPAIRSDDDILTDTAFSFDSTNDVTGAAHPLSNMRDDSHMASSRDVLGGAGRDVHVPLASLAQPDDMQDLDAEDSHGNERGNSPLLSHTSGPPDEASSVTPVANGSLPSIPVIRIDNSSPMTVNATAILSSESSSMAVASLPHFEFLCADEASSSYNGTVSDYPTSPSSLSADDASSESSDGKLLATAGASLNTKGGSGLGVGGGNRRPLTLLPIPIPEALKLPSDDDVDMQGYCRAAPLSPVIEARTPCKSPMSVEPRSPILPRMSQSRRVSTLSVNNINTVAAAAASATDKHAPKEPTPVFPILASPAYRMLSNAVRNIPGEGISGSLISRVLLANADTLCAAASPLLEDFDVGDYEEKSVMNNYFGVGLDAKIQLEFNMKRDEHPEKCRSRTKNKMWYGVIGSKELLQRTYRNLEQRVKLECDGQKIPLPNLQGIVILNIGSYMGGVNFWGGKHEGENFLAPSFDDSVLEVVAVFGSAQLGLSRVIKLQRHRIAQCRSVKITILGDEGVPVQVDGEAWIQPPGYIRIEHKNRIQMLTRDKAFEETLRMWNGRQQLAVNAHPLLSKDEVSAWLAFIQATGQLTNSIQLASDVDNYLKTELLPLVYQTARLVVSSGRLAHQLASRAQMCECVTSTRALCAAMTTFFTNNTHTKLTNSQLEHMYSRCAEVETEMRKLSEMAGLCRLLALSSDLVEMRNGDSGADMWWRHRKEPPPVVEWNTDDVCQWLDRLGLTEYKTVFTSNDIRGQELVSLSRVDLKDLGVTKVGHVKRLEQAVADLRSSPTKR